MKQLLKHPLSVAMGLALLTNQAVAQEKQTGSALQKTLSTSYQKISAVKVKQNEAELKKAADGIISPLKQTIEQLSTPAKKEIAAASTASDKLIKEQQQNFPYKKTSIDLIADLNTVPFPVTDPKLAEKTDVVAMYQNFNSMLDKRKTILGDLAKNNNKVQQVYEKEGQAGLEKRAIAEADQSAIVREMGGTEKLMNMTEAERKAAAEQMKEKLKQNPALLTGGSSDAGMNAMQQKLMSDPAYAKRFSKMSEEEKQAEMKKYMTIKPQGNPNAVYAAVPKSDDHKNAERSQEVDMLILRTYERLKEASATYTRMATASTTAVEAMQQQLRSWQEATTKAIPIIELGEVGHDRDPELMRAMEITSKYANYCITEQEITLRATSLKYFKEAVSAALLEFNNYAGTYKWGQGKETNLFDGTDTDPKIVNAFGGYYNVVQDIGKQSAQITNDASSAQKTIEGTF